MSDAAAQTDIENDAELFRVLGHETRLRLLMLLAAGEHAVSEIDADIDAVEKQIQSVLGAVLR